MVKAKVKLDFENNTAEIFGKIVPHVTIFVSHCMIPQLKNMNCWSRKTELNKKSYEITPAIWTSN